jgi:arylsulfatase A-like enzyme
MKQTCLLSGIILSTLIFNSFAAQGRIKRTLVAGKNENRNPNVIILITDDQGYGELSVHGNPILKTPNLDKLHNQSLRLTDFHACPMSTPTRGQLLTGIDAVRNGANNVSSGRTLLRKEFPTIADYFSGNGYGTGIFGKWHLGDNYPYRPQDRGFRESLWYPSSHIGSVPDYWGNNYFDDVYIRNGKRESFKGYCTDVFFGKAMEWMKKCYEKNEPFFTYLATNTPHEPFIAIEEDIREMQAVVDKSEFSSMESSKKYNLIRYLAMIRNLDNNVGRLMDFLDKEGLSENTILIFLTDNGSTFGPDYYNAGMRGRKTELYEGGHRVPFFIRWPKGYGFNKARDIIGLTEVQDVLPTLLDLCGIKHKSKSFDGISLAPVFLKNKPVPADRTLFINYSRMPFYFDYPSPYSSSFIRESGTGVLWKRWRLLNNKELYDLYSDPLQKDNVFGKFPQVVRLMTRKQDQWWNRVKDIANESSRIIIGSNEENPLLLTACEWKDVFVDQQSQIEKGVHKNSYWLLEVSETGNYEFELRRWPKESKISLTGNSPDGNALPVSAARISISTDQGDLNAKKAVDPGCDYVTFSFRINKGKITLHTWFDDKTGESIAGAYYVYVTRKTDN